MIWPRSPAGGLLITEDTAGAAWSRGFLRRPSDGALVVTPSLPGVRQHNGFCINAAGAICYTPGGAAVLEHGGFARGSQAEIVTVAADPGGPTHHGLKFDSTGRVYADLSLRETALSYVSLTDYWRLGETSGTNAADSKTGANAGTYTGGFTLGQPSNISDGDKSVLLNGSSGFVALPLTIAQFAGGPVSAAIWFKTNNLTPAFQVLYSGAKSSAAFDGWIFTYNANSNHTLGYFSSVSGVWIESTGVVNDTNWHHAAVTVTAGGAIAFYLDGQPAGTAAGSPPGVWAGIKGIGANSDGSGNRFSGNLDELMLFSAVLTPADILRLYNNR